jgi:hypothetical protein
MSKMLCKKYLSGSEKKEEIQASAWKLQKISPSNKKYIYRGAIKQFLPCALSLLVTPLVMLYNQLPLKVRLASESRR